MTMATVAEASRVVKPVFSQRARSILRGRAGLLDLWHLCSFDAPAVAAVWTWFLARTHHVRLPVTSILAMAVAVWLLYAADRLLDARHLDAAGNQPLEARHRFHHLHRRAFLFGIAAATLALAVLLPGLPLEALRLYLIEGSFLSGYFILIHATDSAHRLPKELAVGLFFAAAVFIPSVARSPMPRLAFLIPALLLSALCSLNCLFIYAWEHPLPVHSTHPATRLALHHLHILASTVALVSIAFAWFNPSASPAIFLAIALAAILLQLLNRFRRTFRPTTLRAAADFALLTPLLFLRLL